MASLLKDEHLPVRLSAAKALGTMGAAGAEHAGAAVASLLEDEDPLVRRSTVKALGAMGAAGAEHVRAAVATVLGAKIDWATRASLVQAVAFASRSLWTDPQLIHSASADSDSTDSDSDSTNSGDYAATLSIAYSSDDFSL
eukprot:SAG31_NODE_7263_length_1739_cov_1.105488_2_plen_141_part_00